MAFSTDANDPFGKVLREELRKFGKTTLRQALREELEAICMANPTNTFTSTMPIESMSVKSVPVDRYRSQGTAASLADYDVTRGSLSVMETAGGFLLKGSKAKRRSRKGNFNFEGPMIYRSQTSYSQLGISEMEEPSDAPQAEGKLVRSLSNELVGEETESSYHPIHITLNRVGHGTVHFDSDDKKRAQSWIFALLFSDWFNPFTGFLITINAICIGIETDFMARHWTEHGPIVFKFINFSFLLYFMFEIGLRLVAHGRFFFTQPGYQWNIFDLAMVLLQLVEVTVNTLEHMLPPRLAHVSRNQVMMWRILRLLRLLRIFRFFRILHMFTGLRMLVAAVQDSLKSLLWSIILIVVIVYTLGVCVTQLVTNYKVQNKDSIGNEELEKLYGHLLLSMLSLYEAISEGIHWHELMDPLRKYCSPWMAFFFSLYMAFCLFALLNVITGIFVESAIDAGREDKRTVLMNRMMVLFLQADEDGNGLVDKNEFLRQLGHSEMKKFLKEVQLDEEEAMDLFTMLDTTGSGQVDPEDFVNGCLRLNGFAKAIDLAAFMHEFRLFQEAWQTHASYTHKAVGKIYEDLQTQMAPLVKQKSSEKAQWSST